MEARSGHLTPGASTAGSCELPDMNSWIRSPDPSLQPLTNVCVLFFVVFFFFCLLTPLGFFFVFVSFGLVLFVVLELRQTYKLGHIGKHLATEQHSQLFSL